MGKRRWRWAAATRSDPAAWVACVVQIRRAPRDLARSGEFCVGATVCKAAQRLQLNHACGAASKRRATAPAAAAHHGALWLARRELEVAPRAAVHRLPRPRLQARVGGNRARGRA